MHKLDTSAILALIDRKDRDLERAVGIIERYQDQGIGIADASVVVLAERFGTRRTLTLDHRHFGVLRPLSGGRFSLLA